ncbi:MULTISPECIES: FAD-binding oxidoreductase [unclassified Novosphingobium]|uniref:FAD-binding oxidoreductase n=1 Tax=unclassified Novosphingobium TaxID=2644732 RepID=UPI000D30987F|nr:MULTISPECIES: FAD-binding oxidoreductase [unclassified Novosphingobium]PTR12937.1 FAD/FMN-containing dehydrogenase [Novosphingobium sp. GV055]PUB06721.1 FAD/FMN-containing dehydrogenase [Novosphingobium sp. GV061]PUB22772.1 FAD/FMN-containing dehydrogenase [Novosphingobium sp. GV079]PUB44797.1 FAD/FMN-containing dehydrogenase [Novosphingobium sp. GV027]
MVETLAPRAETAPFLEAAAALLGAKGFTTDPDAISPWLTDWRQRFTGRALGMASPATTDEVAGLVRLCAAHNVPIVPQGGNSGMSGGATPDETGHAVVLSLRRMNAIRSVDTATRSATCEAGVILQVLHEAAEAKGLRFPLSLGGKGSATVGGLISTNAGGTQVLRHGSMRALVLGLEAVMPDGTVFNQLVPLKKDNRGFDLKQLLIGSEGTLGVVTAATLKLEPAVAAREVLWAGTQSLPQARELLLLAERLAGQALEGFEVMPQHSLDAVRDYLPGARQPLAEDHAWHVLIEMVADADGAERLPDLAQRVLEEAFEAGLIDDATMAANETQAEAFWNLRESIAPAERALGPAVQHDISVPVEKMPAFVEEAVPQFEAQWPGTRAVGFGHLGDGNIHFHVIAPQGVDRASWEAGDGKAISRQVHDMVTAWGGSISAEHGIGQLKRDELARLGDPVALSILRHVKQALDPQGLMNPGKLI